MRLTTIGTGTAAPSRGRVQSGYFVDAGDVQLLMDCGSGITTRMADLDLPWQRITHLAITHFHADHVVDVPTMLYAWRYGQLPPRSEPLQIIGPVGTLRLLSAFAGVFGQGPDLARSQETLLPDVFAGFESRFTRAAQGLDEHAALVLLHNRNPGARVRV